MRRSADDGHSSLINTSQQIDAWTTFFSPHVKDANWLGLLTNMFSIGSIISFFITLVAPHYHGDLTVCCSAHYRGIAC